MNENYRAALVASGRHSAAEGDRAVVRLFKKSLKILLLILAFILTPGYCLGQLSLTDNAVVSIGTGTNYLSVAGGSSYTVDNKTTPDLSSLWLVTKSNNSYTLQNLESGNYLRLSSSGATLGNSQNLSVTNDRLSYRQGNTIYYLNFSSMWGVISNYSSATTLNSITYTKSGSMSYSGATTLYFLPGGDALDVVLDNYVRYAAGSSVILGYRAVLSSNPGGCYSVQVADGRISIVAAANSTGAVRSGTLQIIDADGAVFKTITLNQAGSVANFVHQKGYSDRNLVDGMQSVHTERVVVYMNGGETRKLALLEPCYDYVRWYEYGTDNTITTGRAIYPDGFLSLPGNMGKVKFDNINKDKKDISYQMPSVAQRVEVAADMSYYRDYSKQDGYLVKEPTLSQRIVFDIRPSSEMAALLSNKDNSNGSVTGNYLEEYQMIAPAGKVLRVGPMYRYLGTDGNYYKSSSERITTGQWYRNGVAINPSIQNNRVAQITVAQGGAADEEVVYTLVAGGKGIAKFTVKFQSTDKVGPRATELVSAATLDSDYKYITGQRFDVTDKNVPLPWDECGYGFFYPEDNQTRIQARRYTYWSEYAFINTVGSEYNFLKQGVKDITHKNNLGDNGSFFYVDCSTSPGVVANLRFTDDGDLCPGSRMYVSAWVNNLNIEKYSNGTPYTLPNLNFMIIGVNADGSHDVLSTYTTGDLEAGTDCGVWKHIFFDMEMPNKSYDSYRLRVVNNAQNASGNDFGLDEIGVYLYKPALAAYQTSLNCDATEDVMFMLRLKEEDFDLPLVNGNKRVYYQIQKEDGTVIPLLDYLNGNGNNYGTIEIPVRNLSGVQGYIATSTATGLEQYLAARENYITNGGVVPPQFFYVRESNSTAASGYETIFYVFHNSKGLLESGEMYNCVLGADVSVLQAQNNCAMVTGLSINHDADVLVNNAVINSTSGEACAYGNTSIELRIYGTESALGEQVVGVCQSDWLMGQASDYTVPGSDYDDIVAALHALRMEYKSVSDLSDAAVTANFTAAQKQLLESLVQRNKLYLNLQCLTTRLTLGANYFVVVPITGTGVSKDGLKSIEVCGTPVPAAINAVETSRLFNVGYETEDIPDSYFENRVVRISESTANSATLSLPIRDVAFINYGDWSSLEVVLQPTSTDATEGLPYEVSGVSVPIYGTISYSETDGQGYLELTERVAALEYKQGHRYDFVTALPYDGEGCDPVSVFSIIVVPDYVAWNPQSGSHTWHADNNWIMVDATGAAVLGRNGYVPARFTNVVLTNAADVPVLKATTVKSGSTAVQLDAGAQTGIEYDLYFASNSCKNIHLNANAKLGGQDQLIYDSAWVDLELSTSVWNLLAPPFEDMVVGDMYIPTNGDVTPLFTKVAAPDSRRAYEFWASLYNSEGVQLDRNGNRALVRMTEWSDPFNALNTPLVAGQGYSLRVRGQGESSVVVRLPKREVEYYYYGTYGEQTNLKEDIVRTPQGHRLVSTNGRAIEAQFDTRIAEQTYHLVANPYMVEMDIRKFMLDGLNLSTVTGTFGLFSGTSRQLTTYNITSGVSSDGSAMVYTIPPMTSFVVELSSSATNPYLRIHPSMAVDHSAAISSAPAESVWSNPDGVLLIEASRNGLLSSCVLIEDASAVSGCKDGEDSKLLMLSERMTPGAVFTVGGNEALAINVVPQMDMVALGFASFVDDMSDQVVLRFTGVDGFSGDLEIYDAVTRRTVKLSEGMQVALVGLQDYSSRYFIRYVSGTTTEVESVEEDGMLKVYQPQRGDVVLACSSVMTSVRVYSMTGQLVAERTGLSSSYEQFKLSSGVYLFDVESESGVYREKVVVR